MALSAWFVGSITLPSQTISITTAGPVTENVVIAAGSYYLRSATAARSILDLLLAAMNTHSVLSGATAVIRRDRRIVIGATQSFALTWPADNVLRDLLGYTGTLTPTATSFVATNRSPLLWSPGYLATPKTIEGVDGYTVPHQSVLKSVDGTQVYCDHYGTETWQDLSWTHIMPERMRVADSADGGATFHEFFEQCAMLRARFLYHQEIDELDTSTTTVTWDTARGPYVLRDDFGGDWYRRNVAYAEVSSPLDLPIHLVAEYA